MIYVNFVTRMQFMVATYTDKRVVSHLDKPPASWQYIVCGDPPTQGDTKSQIDYIYVTVHTDHCSQAAHLHVDRNLK